jgi:hypothetical protein
MVCITSLQNAKRPAAAGKITIRPKIHTQSILLVQIYLIEITPQDVVTVF